MTTIAIAIFGRVITLEGEPLKKKQLTDTKKDERGLRVITLQGAIKKSLILLSQYRKNEWLDSTIIISYFGDSNNIFAGCICTLLIIHKKPIYQIRGIYIIYKICKKVIRK